MTVADVGGAGVAGETATGSVSRARLAHKNPATVHDHPMNRVSPQTPLPPTTPVRIRMTKLKAQSIMAAMDTFQPTAETASASGGGGADADVAVGASMKRRASPCR